MNLLILETREIGDDGTVRLADVRARHLLRVLNVQPGSSVRVGLLDGPCGSAIVREVAGETVSLACSFEERIAERPRIDLLLAVPRPKVLRRLWAQIAALGVGRIILTNAERVERNYFDTHFLTADVYRPLLIEGLQQARDTRLPEVTIHRRFKVLVEDELDALSGKSTRLVGDPGATTSLASALDGVAEQSRVLLGIGPEGGWNAFELALLEAHGFRRIGLGSRTLRADTACVALMAVVREHLSGE